MLLWSFSEEAAANSGTFGPLPLQPFKSRSSSARINKVRYVLRGLLVLDVHTVLLGRAPPAARR